VRTWRPDYASEIRQLEDGLNEAPMKQRKNPAKLNLRQFFGANVKFQKNLRRCVFAFVGNRTIMAIKKPFFTVHCVGGSFHDTFFLNFL
jgi:hypothetical protein